MTSKNRKFLIFSIQGSLFALDLSQVAEVCDPPHMWPIPLAPACYRGAISFHGDIVAVMDLAIFLGMNERSQCGKTIILHQKIASLAFLIDSVVKIASEEEVLASHGTASDHGFAAATLSFIDGKAILLDLDLLVHKAEIGMQKNSWTSKISIHM